MHNRQDLVERCFLQQVLQERPIYIGRAVIVDSYGRATCTPRRAPSLSEWAGSPFGAEEEPLSPQ